MEKLDQNPTPNETETDDESQGYSIGDIKRAMLGARVIREYCDEVAAHVRGSSGQALDEISKQIFDEADRLYEENIDWVNSKIEGILKQFAVLARDRLKESFQNGLRLHIKRIYRTYKKDSPGNLNYFNDRQYIRDLIAAYATEYLLLLRQARKTTESPNTALTIAKNAHFLTVSDYKNLIRKYANLGYGTINAATIGYPSNPEKFLDGVFKTIARLKSNKKYAGLGDNTINTAATGYPGNPEKYLDGVIGAVARLKADERYAGLGDREINRAALSCSSNPEKYLDDVIETVTRLKADEKYASFGNWGINMAAISYPSNPEKFLDGVIGAVARLKSNKKYAGLGDYAINMAAIGYPGNPEKYLDGLLNNSGR